MLYIFTVLSLLPRERWWNTKFSVKKMFFPVGPLKNDFSSHLLFSKMSFIFILPSFSSPLKTIQTKTNISVELFKVNVQWFLENSSFRYSQINNMKCIKWLKWFRYLLNEMHFGSPLKYILLINFFTALVKSINMKEFGFVTWYLFCLLLL